MGWENISKNTQYIIDTGWNWFLDHTVTIRAILCYNHLLSCILLITASVVITFIPLMMNHLDTNQQFIGVGIYNDVNIIRKYKDWLLISTTSTGPMFVEFVLHYLKSYNCKMDWSGWTSRGLLLLALIGPNLTLYFLCEHFEKYPSSTFPLIVTGLMFAKETILVSSLFMSMFYHKMESVVNVSEKLKISIEDWTVAMLCFWLLQRVFLVSSDFASSYSESSLRIMGIIFTIVTFVLIIFVVVRVIHFLYGQQMRMYFASHEHLSDFCNSWILLIFVIIEIALNLSYQRHNHGHGESVDGYNQEDRDHFLVTLYVQVALTIALTVIPGQSYMLLADIKQQKLNTRLNLIRYVSHEMRTPLNTAFLGLEMLTTDLNSLNNKYATILQRLEMANNVLTTTRALPSPTKELNNDVQELNDTVKQVQDSCKVAVETLDDLLTFDKLDESKLVIEVNDLNPWVFLCDAAKPFEINAKQLDVNFSVALEDDDDIWLRDHYIKGDKFKLAQVVRNLCSNALKFTPPNGFVDVRLALVNANDSKLGRDLGPAVRFTVRDTGAGISIENQKKLFGQYVQFNASKLQQGKGSGLGLWISKSIVEMHGGKIWAYSEGEGKGTTFGLDLPAFDYEKENNGNNLGTLLSAISMRRPGATITSNMLRNNQNNNNVSTSKLDTASVNSGPNNNNHAHHNHGFMSEPNSVNISLLNAEVVFKENPGTHTANNSRHFHVSNNNSIVHNSNNVNSSGTPPSSAGIGTRGGLHVVAGMRHSRDVNVNNGTNTSNSTIIPVHQPFHQHILTQFRNLQTTISNNPNQTNNSSNNSNSGKSNRTNSGIVEQPFQFQPGNTALSMVQENIHGEASISASWTQRMLSMVIPTRASFSSSTSTNNLNNTNINNSTGANNGSTGNNSINNNSTSFVLSGHNKVRPLNSSVDDNDNFAAQDDIENQSARRAEPVNGTGFYSANKLFKFNRSSTTTSNSSNNNGTFLGKNSNGNAHKDGQSITMSTGRSSLPSSHWGEVTMAPTMCYHPPANNSAANNPTNHSQNNDSNIGNNNKVLAGLKNLASSSSNSDSDGDTPVITADATVSRTNHSTANNSIINNRASQGALPFSCSSRTQPYDDISGKNVSQSAITNTNISGDNSSDNSISKNDPLTPLLQKDEDIAEKKDDEEAKQQQQEEARVETTVTPLSWETGLHFLIVDDTPTNRKMLKKLLQSAGHHVSEAHDGVDCLEKLDYHRADESQGKYGSFATLDRKVDVVLMDEHMPRMEGPECASILTKKGFASPIFAITGSVSEEERKHFMDCGAKKVFAKPLKMDLLKQAVQEYFTAK